MISITSVSERLDVLISKAQSLQSTLSDEPTGHAVNLAERSDHTYYGLPEEISEEINSAVAAIVVAEQKINRIYS